MSTWILILVITTSSGLTTSTFSVKDKSECQRVGDLVLNKFKPYTYPITYCIEIKKK